MGLYIHIPFCKQACHYCNFHFSTATKYREEMVAAIVREMGLQRDYLGGADLETIYFGGGTPSILSEKHLETIWSEIHRLFSVRTGAEITLEANPDDLSKDKLEFYKRLGINRLSVGVQSFRSADLRLMNRAHTPEEAVLALDAAFEVGFEEVNLDLIYGIPTSTDSEWAANMEQAFAFPINHLSAYALTVEPKTALAHFIRKGKYPPVEEAQASRQYDQLMDFAKAKGWEHYEISNFALPGKEAIHNTAYWQGKKYLGLGPSAHSFDGLSRQWNVANNQTYMRALSSGQLPAEREILDVQTQYNEYVMTGLRTKWGCNLNRIKQFGLSYARFFRKEATAILAEGLMIEEQGVYRLTPKGYHFADRIASELMVV